MPETTSKGSFNMKELWFYSELLPDVSAPQPIPKDEPRHPRKEATFILNFMGHNPDQSEVEH